MAKQVRDPGSWGPLSLAVMQDERLTMSDKAVWAACVVSAHGLPSCDASQTALARLASTSRNTVAKALSNLERAGWLSISRVNGYRTTLHLRDEGAQPVGRSQQGFTHPHSEMAPPAKLVSTTRQVTAQTRQVTAQTRQVTESGAIAHRERDRDQRSAGALTERDPDQVFAETTFPPLPSEPETRDRYTFRDLMTDQIPPEVLLVPFVARQVKQILAAADPSEFEFAVFYRDPGKPGGWGLRFS